MEKKWRICLWASVQEKNIGVAGYGTEEENMFVLCDIIEGMLNQYGCFEIFRNKPQWGLVDNVNQERTSSIDFVVELHTNAGGGKGTEVYCNTANAEGMELASILYRHISPVSEGKDRGVKDGMWIYDIKNTYATAVLAELFFHDNKTEVIGWRTKKQEYANAIVNAIIEFTGTEIEVDTIDDKIAVNIMKVSGAIHEMEELIATLVELRSDLEKI